MCRQSVWKRHKPAILWSYFRISIFLALALVVTCFLNPWCSSLVEVVAQDKERGGLSNQMEEALRNALLSKSPMNGIPMAPPAPRTPVPTVAPPTMAPPTMAPPTMAPPTAPTAPTTAPTAVTPLSTVAPPVAPPTSTAAPTVAPPVSPSGRTLMAEVVQDLIFQKDTIPEETVKCGAKQLGQTAGSSPKDIHTCINNMVVKPDLARMGLVSYESKLEVKHDYHFPGSGKPDCKQKVIEMALDGLNPELLLKNCNHGCFRQASSTSSEVSSVTPASHSLSASSSSFSQSSGDASVAPQKLSFDLTETPPVVQQHTPVLDSGSSDSTLLRSAVPVPRQATKAPSPLDTDYLRLLNICNREGLPQHVLDNPTIKKVIQQIDEKENVDENEKYLEMAKSALANLGKSEGKKKVKVKKKVEEKFVLNSDDDDDEIILKKPCNKSRTVKKKASVKPRKRKAPPAPIDVLPIEMEESRLSQKYVYTQAAKKVAPYYEYVVVSTRIPGGGASFHVAKVLQRGKEEDQLQWYRASSFDGPWVPEWITPKGFFIGAKTCPPGCRPNTEAIHHDCYRYVDVQLDEAGKLPREVVKYLYHEIAP